MKPIHKINIRCNKLSKIVHVHCKYGLEQVNLFWKRVVFTSPARMK